MLILSPFLQQQISLMLFVVLVESFRTFFCIILVGTISLDVSCTEVNLCSIL